ncbi:hypothetical protein ABK040_012400 [Willaertia magna]
MLNKFKTSCSFVKKISSSHQKLSFLQKNNYSNVTSAKPVVTIYGGNGYLGQELIKRIAPNCEKVIIACRRTEEMEAVAPKLGGNVSVVYSDITNKDEVAPAMYGSDVVINLAGLIYESENTFVQVFVDGAKNVAHNASVLGVNQLIHLGFLNSDLDSKSFWSDMKFRSEDIVYGANPNATIVKPSMMFDSIANTNSSAYLNRLRRSWLKFLPVIPLPHGNALVQPVFIGDVVSAIEKCIFSKANETKGKNLYLAGPDVVTFKEAISMVTKKPTVPLNYVAYDFIIGCTQMLPEPVVTRDQLNIFKQDNGDLTLDTAISKVIDPAVRSTIMTFNNLDIQPTPMSKVL